MAGVAGLSSILATSGAALDIAVTDDVMICAKILDTMEIAVAVDIALTSSLAGVAEEVQRVKHAR